MPNGGALNGAFAMSVLQVLLAFAASVGACVRCFDCFGLRGTRRERRIDYNTSSKRALGWMMAVSSALGTIAVALFMSQFFVFAGSGVPGAKLGFSMLVQLVAMIQKCADS